MMNQNIIDRIEEIQKQQYEALEQQDVQAIQVLEQEKTCLLHQSLDFATITPEQKQQLESILNAQQALETVMVEVKDELSSQINDALQRQKAVKAYRSTD